MMHLYPDQWISKRLKAHFLCDRDGVIIRESRHLVDLFDWLRDEGIAFIELHAPDLIYTLHIDHISTSSADHATLAEAAEPLLPFNPADKKEIKAWRNQQDLS